MKAIAVILSALIPFLGEAAGHSLDWLAPNALKDLRFRGLPFKTTGQILLRTGQRPARLLLHNESLRTNITVWDDRPGKPRYQCGDVVSVCGTIASASAATRREFPSELNACFVTNIAVTSHSHALPATTPVTPLAINSGEFDQRFVQAEGIVSSIVVDPTNQDWIWIILRSNGEKVRAAATRFSYTHSTLASLVGAKVRLSGVVNKFSSWRQHLGYHLVLFGLHGVHLVEPAQPPFSVPVLHEGDRVDGRQQVAGHVLGTRGNQVFLADHEGHFVKAALCDTPPSLSPGEGIAISGFAEHEPIGVSLISAFLRREPKGDVPPPSALDIDPERMFTNEQGHGILDATLYGKLVRVNGQVANTRESILASGKVALNSGARTLGVDVTDIVAKLPENLEQGALVRITGICLADFDANFATLTFPTFKGFELIPRGPDDVSVLKRAPFWTPGRFAMALAFLFIVLIALFVWNRSINTISKKRAAELAREQISSARAYLKVEERTRLAVELHDALSQTLTGVALQLDAVNRFADNDRGKMANHLGIATRMLKSCRDELRNCLWDLRNKALEESDMNVAIRRTVNPFIGDAKLVTRFNISRDQLSDDAVHSLLRIIRELASNAVRHGQATDIRIAGALENGRLLFSVSDNGSGFEPDKQLSANEGHFGLDGIRERIERLSGTMKITSSRGRGTTVTISIQA